MLENHICSNQANDMASQVTASAEVAPRLVASLLAVCIFFLREKLETLTCCIIEPKTFSFEFECLVFCRLLSYALKKLEQ